MRHIRIYSVVAAALLLSTGFAAQLRAADLQQPLTLRGCLLPSGRMDLASVVASTGKAGNSAYTSATIYPTFVLATADNRSLLNDERQAVSTTTFEASSTAGFDNALYMLAGRDLSRYVGQEVEVTGVMQDSQGHAELHFTGAVQMISPTCSW